MAAPQTRHEDAPPEPETLPPAAIPYVEIRLYLEGRATGCIRGCGADESVAERVLEWVEQDNDRAAIVEAYRRLRDRQAA